MFRAVAADGAYGDQDGFRGEHAEAGLPFVMALKPRRGMWAYGPDVYTPVDAARALAWDGPEDPGDWQAVTRTYRDGHTQTWWAADARLGWWGPDGTTRLVVATAHPGILPDKATWYLATNLPGQPARSRQPAPGREPRGGRADLRDPALDRGPTAGLAAGRSPGPRAPPLPAGSGPVPRRGSRYPPPRAESPARSQPARRRRRRRFSTRG